MIVKHGKTYVILSADGTKHLGGPFASEGEAKKRLEQIEYFKNRGKK